MPKASAKVKTLFGYRVQQTEKVLFAFAEGAHSPNVIFSIEKTQMFIDPEFTVNPIAYIKDKEVTDAMHVEFGGIPSFILGTYRPTPNHRYFDISDPIKAQHVLIKVEWGGGAAPGKTGSNNQKVKQYKHIIDFTHSKSNYSGNDYWIVPVGFYVGASASPCRFKQRGQKYCQYYSDLRRENLKSAKEAARQRQINEEASRICRPSMIKRLKFLQERLSELRRYTNRYIEDIDFSNSTYYKVGYKSFLYSKENVDATEAWFCDVEDKVLEDLAKK